MPKEASRCGGRLCARGQIQIDAPQHADWRTKRTEGRRRTRTEGGGGRGAAERGDAARRLEEAEGRGHAGRGGRAEGPRAQADGKRRKDKEGRKRSCESRGDTSVGGEDKADREWLREPCPDMEFATLKTFF